MRNKKITMLGLLVVAMLAGCGNKVKDNPEVTDIDSAIEAFSEVVAQPAAEATTEAPAAATEATTEPKPTTNYDIPLMNELGEEAYLEKVGAKKHDTTTAFELTDDLRWTIETLFLNVGRYNAKDLDTRNNWKGIFVDRFLKNSWYSCEYLSGIYDGDSLMDKDQIEYFHYSLTGRYIEFNEYSSNPLDTSQASSGFNTAHTIDYDVTENGDEVNLVANVGMCEGIKEDYDSIFKVEVVLKKNPYSCFDGYSITSLDYEETTTYQAPDGKEHVVYGWFMEYYEDEKTILFEYADSDEEINAERNFSHFVSVDISEHPEFYDFVKEHEEAVEYFTYKITFIFDESNPAPFETIKPTAIGVKE